MDNSNDTNTCGEGKTPACDQTVDDCIQKLNGMNISNSVTTLEGDLDRLTIAENEDKEKPDKDISKPKQASVPECKPSVSDVSTCHSTQQLDVQNNTEVLDDGPQKEILKSSNNTDEHESDTELEASEDSKDSKVAIEKQVDPDNQKRDTTADYELTCDILDEEEQFKGKGPLGGRNANFTRTVEPNPVYWHTVQPGVRRRSHSPTEDGLKFVRMGPGLPVENDDNVPSWDPILEEDIINQINELPEDPILTQLEAQLDNAEVTTPIHHQGGDYLPQQSPLGGYSSDYSASVNGSVFSDQGSPASGMYGPITGQQKAYPVSPIHHQSPQHQQQQQPQQSCYYSDATQYLLHSPPSLQHQYSPAGTGSSTCTLSPYSNHTLGSPSSTTPDSPVMRVQANSPAGVLDSSQGHQPYPGTHHHQQQQQQQGLTQTMLDYPAGSPDSALGAEPADGQMSAKTTAQHEIHCIAETLKSSADMFITKKRLQEQEKRTKEADAGQKQAPADRPIPETVKDLIETYTSGIGDATSATVTPPKTESTSSMGDVKSKIREGIMQRRGETGKQENSGTSKPSSVTGATDPGEPVTTTKNRRGRPLGSKNKPRNVAKVNPQKTILPENVAPPCGPNVTSVIIISQGNGYQGNGYQTTTSSDQPGKTLVIPPPKQYQPILPREEVKSEASRSSVSPSSSLVLQKPQRSTCKMSEASDDPTEVEKKSMLKAERIVADIPTDLLSYVDNDGDTLLHDLSLVNCDELLENLLDKPMSLLTIGIVKDRHMFQALIDRMEREQILPSLIDKPNQLEQTPLYMAVVTNKPDLLQLLLDKGANPNNHVATRGYERRPSGFRMPLHVAAEKGRDFRLVLQILLRSPNIEVDIRNSERRTPLHVAVDSHGSRPCETAEPVNNDETVKLLIQHGAKILNGPNDRTPLHTLVERQNLSFLKYVVSLLPPEQRDEALNLKDSNGNTCLHIAAAHTSKKQVDPVTIQILETLLQEWEVDLSIKNSKSQTAKMAVPKHNEQVLDIFRLADVRRKNKNANLGYKLQAASSRANTNPSQSSLQGQQSNQGTPPNCNQGSHHFLVGDNEGIACQQQHTIGNDLQASSGSLDQSYPRHGNQINEMLGNGNQGEYNMQGNRMQGNLMHSQGNQGNMIQDHGYQGNLFHGNGYQATFQIVHQGEASESALNGMGHILNIPTFQHRGVETVGH